VIPASKVQYLPFGIDTDLFFPATADKNKSRETIEIFSNRGFFSVYDTGTLVQGFAQAYEQEPRLRLKLKGEGPEKQSIRNLVDCLGLADKISFGKKTDYSEVPLDYRQADIFVTTSRSDGTPVSILEAMASGLPCVATSVGGIPEWIENNRTGLLIEPESPKQLAEAILELATDPSRRELIGTAAREVIVRRGQWKLLMVQAEKDYLDLIKTYKQDKS
jgi:glycosyltransferase involved in cell wall biosynthesis